MCVALSQKIFLLFSDNPDVRAGRNSNGFISIRCASDDACTECVADRTEEDENVGSVHGRYVLGLRIQISKEVPRKKVFCFDCCIHAEGREERDGNLARHQGQAA